MQQAAHPVYPRGESMSNNPLEILHEFVEWAHGKRADFNQIVKLTIEQYLRTNEPQWDDNVPSDISKQPYVVNYKNRRHIFIFNPGSTALTLTDGTGEWKVSLPPNAWSNVSFPNSLQLTASAGPAIIKVKCTDEVVP